MNQEPLYFTDNFFSTGKTDIYNEQKEKIGELDLISMFSSGVDVLDQEGNIRISGRFPFLSSKWKIYDHQAQEIGSLKSKFAFFAEKYEYEAYGRDIFFIKSEAFSKLYEIYKEETNLVGKFERVSGFFSSPAFKLTSYTDQMSSQELIAIVMGVNAIQKRRRSNGASAGATT
ncbi:hypothetical protein [Bacillus sp. EAC]|uniref:hypothetical protein n=1 Tax=Bacillus sp. EAC TaxID=1978338 RepID=UPI000B44963D|nr:hypothetical protein [Bacillus sp. EAC]